MRPTPFPMLGMAGFPMLGMAGTAYCNRCSALRGRPGGARARRREIDERGPAGDESILGQANAAATRAACSRACVFGFPVAGEALSRR